MSSPTKVSHARKPQQKAENREIILAAARQIVVESGFAALSIRKLATSVGSVPGTIYLYFASRDALIRELCIEGFAELAAGMSKAAEAGDPRRRIVALLRAYASFALHNPDMYRLSFMEAPRFSEVAMSAAPLEPESGAGRQAFGLIVEALRQLKQNGSLGELEDETLLAEILWTGVHGVVSLKLIYPAFPATPTDVLVNKMIETLLAGCGLQQEGQG